jgi:hypothetical protein
MEVFVERVSAVLEEGAAANEVRADVDTARSARLLLGMMQSVALQWMLTGRGFDPVAEGLGRFDILWCGLAGHEDA